VIFGHYGDCIGRRATLIATLMCMGVATFLVAFVPTYESIGIWGAVILTVLRAIQGIGVGGEWGGSVLLAMEWSRHHGHRGLVASWPQFGAPAGMVLANVSVLAFSMWSGDQFAIWGWRVPFALSIVLVGVGLWIRLGILETPVFQRLLDEEKIERTPIIAVIKKQPKQVLLSASLRMSEQAPSYIFSTFIFAYAVSTLHLSRNFILTAVIVGCCGSAISIPLAGHISDRIGRRKTYLIGAATTGIFGFLYFAIGALIVAVGVLGWMFYDGQWRSDSSNTAIERSADAIGDAADDIGDAARDAARNIPAPQPVQPAPTPPPAQPSPG
jgi:MFS family permease